jgi:hypothetical protein
MFDAGWLVNRDRPGIASARIAAGRRMTESSQPQRMSHLAHDPVHVQCEAMKLPIR